MLKTAPYFCLGLDSIQPNVCRFEENRIETGVELKTGLRRGKWQFRLNKMRHTGLWVMGWCDIRISAVSCAYCSLVVNAEWNVSRSQQVPRLILWIGVERLPHTHSLVPTHSRTTKFNEKSDSIFVSAKRKCLAYRLMDSHQLFPFDSFYLGDSYRKIWRK